MKVVFLTLLLGLVCVAQEEEAEQSVSELSGEWRIAYFGSTETDKTTACAGSVSDTTVESVPTRLYITKVVFSDDEETVDIYLCVERDGKWEKVHITGKKTDDGTYVFEYEGTMEFIVKYASDNVLVLCVSNTDAKCNVTQLAAILVKVNIEAEALDTFYALVKEKGIEEKCILKIIESDDCPPCGK